jgi:hypothetical protein
MTVEMNDSQFPWIAETSSFPEEMREFITSDLPIVPAMMTVLLPEKETSVGPVKFSAGPTVYFSQVSFTALLLWQDGYSR